MNSLEDTQHWETYIAQPTSGGFSLIVNAARQLNAIDQLFAALLKHAGDSDDWRFSQHLAQLCIMAHQPLYGHYFARRALEQSNGNIFARLSVAHCLWGRRLPGAVLYELEVLRVQARTMKSRRRRKLVQRNIAELHALCAAYTNDSRAVVRWYRHLHHSGATRETFARLAFTLDPRKLPWPTIPAAMTAALVGLPLNPKSRAFGRVRRAIRTGLVMLLRTRI